MTNDGVDRFNSLPDGPAAAGLSTCLAVPRWVREVLAGRPYRTERDVIDQARTSAAALSDDEVAQALARHPRIGERAGADHDAAFSQREQAAVGDADAAVQDAIMAGNLAYEQRFGRVFLIRAQGRRPEEILAELNRRLSNDTAVEATEVVGQLGEIAVGRLKSLLAG